MVTIPVMAPIELKFNNWLEPRHVCGATVNSKLAYSISAGPKCITMKFGGRY